jgi:hypothetical protein
MKRSVIIIFLLVMALFSYGQSYLKSVIYDFDGLDIDQTDLPDGDYRNNDLTYKVAANPLTASDVLGDRVLQMDLNWVAGAGEFGKNMSRFIDLNSSVDRLNFYFYNPTSNLSDAVVHVSIAEDDDKDNVFDYNSDDKWVNIVTIPRSAGWQLISLPLSSFADSTPGGNGIFDAGYTGNGGMIFSIGFTFNKPSLTINTDQYYMDMICFSEGTLPTGSSIFDLPGKSAEDHCLLGGLTFRKTADSIPADIEGLFGGQANNKLRFVNWFLDYSSSGTTPSSFTGQEVQNLLNNGYRPVVTWEMMYSQYPRLDPVQPRFDQLLAGNFDSYIDAFADKIKSYNDTIIMRIFHEFEGNWYPWSLTENNHDPAMYVTAFRHVVDRFRARGATKVQWMWCVNAEPKPYRDYNWIVAAYPGDDYVNMVATDIYNHPDLGTPPWKSFRYTLAENYYYLIKYFPNKPFYICEVACRERDISENSFSQLKSDWLCTMNKELQSYFSRTRALIFFSAIKEHDWRLNSSPGAQSAISNCIWNDNYYFGGSSGVNDPASDLVLNVYPDPFVREINITAGFPVSKSVYEIRIYDMMGRNVLSLEKYQLGEKIIPGKDLSPGIYIIDLKNEFYSKRLKIIKAAEE